MATIADLTRERVLVYDGSKGVMLQLKGLAGGHCAEEWNLSRPDQVCEVHRSYIEAGADVIQTNTFCANGPQLTGHGLEDKLYEINFEGARLALGCAAGTQALVAASIGPTGLFFQPAGEMTFEMAVEIFRTQLQPLKDAGITIVNFETFTDLNEMRAAIVAAQELGGLEIIASMTFDGQRTMSGNTPQACAVTFAAMGAAIVGANCSGGPESLMEPIEGMRDAGVFPLSVKPNAGLPEMESGVAVFEQKPQDFARMAPEFINCGVRLIGGCCGSGPEHIAALRRSVDSIGVPKMQAADRRLLASAYEAAAVRENSRIALMEMDTDGIRAGIAAGDFYCMMDALPPDMEEADFVQLNFGGMEADFDVWQLASTLAMFVKKPVVVNAKPPLAQAFLRCYPGRAGILGSANAYGALRMA